MSRILILVYSLVLLCLTACDAGEPPPISINPDDPFSVAEENVDRWVWIPVEESICRDGSSTGIGVRLQDNASGLMIYLQGGGGCYDAQSCNSNSETAIAGANYSSSDFTNWTTTLGNQGVFNLSQASNPVGDWNHVYIPYCTGDVHGGLKPNAQVTGVTELQQFMGYQNMTVFLGMLSSYFKDIDELVLAGASAGGIGTILNFSQTADAFKSKKISALIDSAPMFPDGDVKTSCFQEKVISNFNLQLPEDCPNCRNTQKGGLANLYNYLATKYPNANFGFASADADLAGVILLDGESKACGGIGVNIFNYKVILKDLRDTHLVPSSNWSSFYWSGLHHTMSQTNSLFFNQKVKGLTIADWFGQTMDGTFKHLDPQ